MGGSIGSCVDSATARLRADREGSLDGGNDPRVGTAPADVAVQRPTDLILRRIRLPIQQANRAHDDAGCAKAALQSGFGEKRGLNRMKCAVALEALDRNDGSRADV